MGERIRAHDWSATPLGPLERWPQSLRTALSIMLDSKFPSFMAWGPELTILYNDAYRPILGTKPEALGRPFPQVWAEIWEELAPIVARAQAGKASYYENLPLTLERGGLPEQTWWTFSYSPIRDERGEVGGIWCTVHETTAIVLAERKHRAEVERLRELFQQAPGAVALLRGPEHVFEMVNAAYLRLIGHRDVIGKRIAEALPEITAQGFIGLLDEVYRRGEPYIGHSVSVQLQRTPGAELEERLLDFVYQPHRDARGAVTGILVQATDVTERTRAEAAMRASETRLRAVIQASPFPMMLHAEDGEIIEISRKWFELTGYAREQIRTHFDWGRLAYPDEYECFAEQIQSEFGRDGELAVGEWRVRTRNGSHRTWDFYIVGLGRLPDGRKLQISAAADVTERKHAERVRAHLAAIVESSDDAIVSKTLEGVVTSWNVGAERLFGYSAGEMIGQAITRIIPQDRLSEEDWILAQLRRGQPIEHYETERQRKDGSLVSISITVSPVRDATGEIIGASKIARDITERKRAELLLRDHMQKLAASERRLQAIFMAQPECVKLVSPEGRLIDMNPAGLAMIEADSIEQVRGAIIYDVIAPETLPAFRRLHDAALEGEPLDHPLEFQVIGLRGTRRWMESRSVPLHDGSGNITSVLSVTQDITERKRVEQALRRTEKRLSRIFETNLLGVLYFDINGGVQEANDEFLRIIGYDRQDLQNGLIDWSRMTPEEYKAQDERAVAELRRSGAHAPVEKQYTRKDGTRVWVLVGSAMVEGDNGVGFVLDLSGLKAADEALREADRRKDEFLATLAHELRNPLAPIRTAVQVLQTPGLTDVQQKWTTDVIGRQTWHMARLLDDLLDVSRITRGKLELRKERVAIRVPIEAAIETARPLIAAKGHELRLDLPAQPIVLDADPVRVTQIVGNLLTNAAKYTDASGEIQLFVGTAGQEVIIRVRDTGIGMTEKQLSSLFEMFTQAPEAVSRSEGGLGVGLAITKGLVELHGGSIEAHSEGPGKGSEFVVKLPLGGAAAGI